MLVSVLPDAVGSTAQLEIIQSRLLDVGSAVATPVEASGPGTAAKQQRVQFDAEATSALEAWIDQMDQELPQLTNFILPSGTWMSNVYHSNQLPMLVDCFDDQLLRIMQAVMRHHLCTWPGRFVDEQSEQLCHSCNRLPSVAMLAFI
jgi:Cobalamin adenosyltransferase